ncbi:cysteine desulfurase-like protein [Aquipuribacter hungaricus]|uniref:Cysteine desulfurase-like protein n=1 Tax=Aquipuribacter hungaricus TaxID=545624 RepID=A0ABV7WDL3_9MICO
MTALPVLDVAALRARFPQLVGGSAHFDGPGGTQTPDVVADAVRATLLAPLANRGTLTRAARNAEAVVQGARAALGDLLAVPAQTVVVGRSATQLTFDLARTLSAGWGPGDEVVVTRLDHDANVRPWVRAAEAVGATVRRVPFDPATSELVPEDVAAQLSPRTRLVAVTGASNLLGTRPDLPAVAALVHEVGALLHVDGVHLAPHAVVDVPATGADTFVCSPYKFLGPHHGVLTGRAGLLEELRPDKLDPSSDAVPERFELGTLPYELLAGTTAAVDLLAGLVPAPDGTDRRSRLVASMGAVGRHEDRLRARAEDGLRDLGATVRSRAARRTPTLLCTFDDHRPADVARALAAVGVDAPAGHFYAQEASRWLGLGDEGGLRVGMAPYTDDDDVDRLLGALADVLR